MRIRFIHRVLFKEELPTLREYIIIPGGGFVEG